MRLRLETAERALGTLEGILHEPFTLIVRDAAIQRFEYSFEAVWKGVKGWLQEAEGVICNSPKRCWRELLTLELADAEETALLLTMTDDRNLTSHTYIEAVAQAIYLKLPVYRDLMTTVLARLRNRLNILTENDDND